MPEAVAVASQGATQHTSAIVTELTTMDVKGGEPGNGLMPGNNAGLLGDSVAESELSRRMKAAHKKKKQRAKKGMKPGAPASVIVRGFESPSISCAEDSDAGESPSAARAMASSTGSPMVRSSGLSRAISELKLGRRSGSEAPSEDGSVSDASSVSPLTPARSDTLPVCSTDLPIMAVADITLR